MTCIAWDNGWKNDYPDSGLDDNFCRNPDGEDTIWCFTNHNGSYDFCDPLSEAHSTTWGGEPEP